MRETGNVRQYWKLAAMGVTKKAKVTFTCTFETKEYLGEWSAEDRRTISNLVEGLVEEAIVTRKKTKAKADK
jgi:hypothetical protein